MIDLNSAPPIREALAFERKARESAYLEITMTVCGIELQPLALRHCVILIRIDSPFLCGKRLPNTEDVLNFLWILSPAWDDPKIRFDSKARIRFARAHGNFNPSQARAEIDTFVKAAFMDAPPQCPNTSHFIPKTSFVASYVHTLASRYGWTDTEILRMPIARIFEYLRCITLERDPKAILFNPVSDKARRDYVFTLHNAANAVEAIEPTQ